MKHRKVELGGHILMAVQTKFTGIRIQERCMARGVRIVTVRAFPIIECAVNMPSFTLICNTFVTYDANRRLVYEHWRFGQGWQGDQKY
jgi:hypothetical protein